MKKLTVSALFTAVSFALLPYQVLFAADLISARGIKNQEGSFQSFKNDRFYFQATAAKKTLNEQRINVEKLVVEPAAKVIIIPRGKKKTDNMKLKGYEKSNFIFVDSSGKEVSIPGSQISSITPDFDSDRGGGSAENDTPGPARMIVDMNELSSWMKEGNPTEAQTKAFEGYKAARTKYDDFVKDSTALVKAMDKSTGPTREDFLNKLRKRKNDEQTLLGELKKAETELLTAFPEIKVSAQKK